MRNLKKVLSLVLCVAMMLSVMVMSTGAASFTDEDKVSDNYAEAVEVLIGMGVIKGDDNNAFRPQDSITRAEVSTLIYRAATADVNNGHPGLTAGANLFTDVSEDDWFAGYVNYCADAEYVKGYEDNTFRAGNDVTGYEVLAMILRAVGYDKNNEFTGLSWTIQVASTATKLGMLKNLDDSVSLAAPATREVVAELIFRAIEPGVDTVHYSPAAGEYRSDRDGSLGEQKFHLDSTIAFDQYDRPNTTWYNTETKADYAVIDFEVLAEYTTAVDQCTVAEDLGLTKPALYQISNNGNPTGVNATLPANGTGVGVDLGSGDNATGTGVLTQVFASPYAGESSGDFRTVDYIVVEIDTYLAQVVGTEEATFDANGHTKTPATIYLNVYDQDSDTASLRYLTNGDTNYTYTAGQMLLLNGVSYSATNDQLKSAASISYKGTPYYVLTNAEIVDVAASVVGAQSYVYSDNSRTVADTKYASNVQFNHDATNGDVGKTNFAWYFDLYGNLIGSFQIADTYTYGAIENIQWIHPTGSTGYAQATLRYMDNSTGTVIVKTLNGNTLALGTSNGGTLVSDEISDNYKLYAGNGMYRITDNGDGTVSLNHVDIAGIGGERISGANVKTGVAAISGTSGKATVTDNATQYLIAIKDSTTGECTFSAVTGYTNVANYTGVEVDYVNLDNDPYAEYVYILGSADKVETENIAYLDTTSYFYDNNTRTYVFNDAYVNGVKTDVRVDADTFTTMNAAGDDTLWFVAYKDGVGDSASRLDTATATSVSLGSTGLSANAYTVTEIGEGVLTDNWNLVWNVNESTVYGGEYAVGDTVVIVYDNTNVSTYRTAVAVYVIGK